MTTNRSPIRTRIIRFLEQEERDDEERLKRLPDYVRDFAGQEYLRRWHRALFKYGSEERIRELIAADDTDSDINYLAHVEYCARLPEADAARELGGSIGSQGVQARRHRRLGASATAEKKRREHAKIAELARRLLDTGTAQHELAGKLSRRQVNRTPKQIRNILQAAGVVPKRKREKR